MKDVKITKLNDTFMKVQCREEYMEYEIADRFSFEVPDAKFDPRVKRGQWDGIKRLYNRRYKRMYVGLLYELIKFLQKQDYTFSVDPKLLPQSSIDVEDIRHIVKEIIKPHDDGNPIELYDYQEDAVEYMMNMGRSICLAATSAGKSLSIYVAVRMYQLLDEFDDKKIFIVVPSKYLCEQMYNDFYNYSNYEDTNWNVAAHCQKINGKYTKNITKQIVITTWQSMAKLTATDLADAGAIFVDEVHTVKGNVLTKLLESSVDCPIRHGLTGTLDNMECNELAAEGLLGPRRVIVTAKEIIDQGRATPLKINCMILDYDINTKRRYDSLMRETPKTKKFHAELEFIYSLQSRFNFVKNLAQGIEGNTLILFDRNEIYGIPLYEKLLEEHPNTFLIVGDTDVDDREEIKRILEDYDDAIICASYGTMSTGVSFKKLHNLILASSSKSIIRVLQSLGRLMRKHDTKDVANIYDIIDKIDHNGKKNYVYRHVEERIKFYSKEKHAIKFYSLDLNEST